MKISAGFIVLVIFCDVLHAQSHSIQWGKIALSDHLLYRRIVFREYEVLRIVSEDVSWPDASNPSPGNSTISCIKAEDLYVNGDGGYASISSGGVGFNHTTVHFESQRNHGYAFKLLIYGPF
ncbi:probable salivary secreted peptide [Phlebotomus argentipes]|uniref:probable salivary secreted peptide n=1 Tax=Phlebotomus argentipes TaxID=94469 RepID=UPI002892B24C|nr:probable salivary secreted peptide [Phlebotomus argentipes]